MPNTTINKNTQKMSEALAPFDKEIASVHGLMSHLYLERVWANMTPEGLRFAVEVQPTRDGEMKKSKWCVSPLEAYRDMFPMGAPAQVPRPKMEGPSCPA